MRTQQHTVTFLVGATSATQAGVPDYPGWIGCPISYAITLNGKVPTYEKALAILAHEHSQFVLHIALCLLICIRCNEVSGACAPYNTWNGKDPLPLVPKYYLEHPTILVDGVELPTNKKPHDWVGTKISRLFDLLPTWLQYLKVA